MGEINWVVVVMVVLWMTPCCTSACLQQLPGEIAYSERDLSSSQMRETDCKVLPCSYWYAWNALNGIEAQLLKVEAGATVKKRGVCLSHRGEVIS